MTFTFTFFTWLLLLIPMPAIIGYTLWTFIVQCRRQRRTRDHEVN